MASKTFTSGTIIDSPWLNDVNNAVYNKALPNGEAIANTASVASAVSSVQGMKNRIINGKMDIAQRGTSFSVAAGSTTTYAVDRFSTGYNSTTSGAGTIAQQADAPPDNEFQNSLRFTVVTATATYPLPAAIAVQHIIEGYNVRDLTGRTFTLSFWVRSAKTGIHCVGFRNDASDRSYVAEYTINAINTWEKKTVTVAGGLITAGTWNYTNGAGLRIIWSIGLNSGFTTNANAWQVGNFYATANQVNVADTVGNVFAITGVQLEVGSVATSFEHRQYGVELALCLRYYWQTPNGSTTGAQPANITGLQFPMKLPVPMRVLIPTVTKNPNLVDANYVAASPTGVQWTVLQSNVVFGTKTGTANVQTAPTGDQLDVCILGASFSCFATTITAPYSLASVSAEL